MEPGGGQPFPLEMLREHDGTDDQEIGSADNRIENRHEGQVEVERSQLRHENPEQNNIVHKTDDREAATENSDHIELARHQVLSWSRRT